jgi:hypothetical protein
MTSIQNMIIRISGLGSREISTWEYDFIRSIVEQSDGGKVTTALSSKQVEIVQRIHDKHFAG